MMSIQIQKIILIGFLLMTQLSVAQEKNISGTVTDENGVPLPGVNITVEKSSKGTTTDFDGKYEIELEQGNILKFSSVGFEDQEITVGDNNTVDVVMKAGTALDEVVIGFESISKEDVTSSISSVELNEEDNASSTNFVQALQGRAPGVTAMETSGQPGANIDLTIRSNASFASGGPLYVVDGVIINDASNDPGSGTRYGGTGINRSPLNFLNPNDIESIDILKDASATAIYGARAAGGVVEITTKKGSSGKPKVQYNFSYSFDHETDYYDLLNAKDYMKERNNLLKEDWMRDNEIGVYGGKDPSSTTPFEPKFSQAEIEDQKNYPSNFDRLLRSGHLQKHSISVSGKSNKTGYYISGNYTNQEGVFKRSDFNDFSGKISLDQEIADDFKIGVNIITHGSKSNNGYIGDGQNEASGMLGAAVYQPPNLPVKDDDGNYVINPEYQNTPNPISFLEITDFTKDKRLLTSGYGQWEILDGLTAKVNLSYDQSTSTRKSYLPRTFLYGARQEGEAHISENNSTTKAVDYTLSYQKNFLEDHDINVLIGHSYQLTKRQGHSLGNDHFPTDNFLFNDLSLGTADKPYVNSWKDPNRVWKSYFGRIRYTYKNRYTLSAIIRGDGASHFAENKKWGVFPGISAAWNISRENFLKNKENINMLKLRIGYGEVGNADIGSSAFSYYSNEGLVNYVFGNKEYPGVQLSQLANPNLTWETQQEFNGGLDFGFFNSRITGSIDYYRRTFKNLLTSVPLPSDFIVSEVATNAGKTRSSGIEVSLTSKNLVSHDGLNWNTTVNFSHFNNRWVRRSPESLRSLEKYVDPKGGFNDVYGYLSDGLYDPEKMKKPSWMPNIEPGEIILKDVNGYDDNGNLTGEPDGKISSADKVVINKNGSNKPRYTFGLNNQFSYKNFDLSIFAYAAIQKKVNTDLRINSETDKRMNDFGWNTTQRAKDTWKHDNRDAVLPTGLSGGYDSFTNDSDFWIEDASFIRIRNITLGYNLSTDLLEKLKYITNARFFVSMKNPFLITSYNGVDPELKNFLSYPITKSVILGARITF